MTPVERWRTCSGVVPRAAATASPMAAWSASPAGPVAALALPEVAIDGLGVARRHARAAGGLEVRPREPDRGGREAVGGQDGGGRDRVALRDHEREVLAARTS